MRLGIWTPLPHTIRAEPAMEAGVQQVRIRGADGASDKSFAFALDVVTRAEALGFDITLIAERLLGPDLEAWMLTAALAAQGRMSSTALMGKAPLLMQLSITVRPRLIRRPAGSILM